MRGLTLGDTALVGKVAYNPFTQTAAVHGVWASDPYWTPPADGSTITTWRNGGSVGGDPTQGTASARPTYRASTAAMNNRPTAQFDGGDSLSFDIADIAQPFCFLAVASLDATGVGRTIMGLSTSASQRLGVSATPAWFSSAGTTLAGGTPNTSPHVVEGIFNGASSSIWVDGTSVASGNAGAGSLVQFVVGASNGNQWLGHIALALVYTGSTRNAQAARDAGSYYGITVA